MTDQTVDYHYTITFDDGRTHTFEVSLSHRRLELKPKPRGSWPDWTRLGYKQCSNCPLEESRHPRCPIAANLVDVVEIVQDWRSYEEVDVRVRFHAREYVKRTSLQQVASSLIGIFTVTGGCPVLDKFRPMVDTHLPFMTPEEVCYRVISMYLFAQFALAESGSESDWTLEGLSSFLDEARVTNAGFCERLRSLGIEDASLNALTILNAQGELTRFALEGKELDRWLSLFRQTWGRTADDAPER